MEYEPYQPPDDASLGRRPPLGPPPVWTWYVVYSLTMGLMYLSATVAFFFMMAFAPEMAAESDEDELALQIQAIAGLIFCIPFTLVYCAAPFLPKKKWSWIYGCILIGIGMTSVCCLPATIPLLIFWLKPETKVFFGMEP